MPRHHRRRILFEYDDDHGACDPWLGCPSPPSPPPYTFSPTPSPSPSPRPSDWSFLITPPVPACEPAPSPDRQPAAGRRNQWATNTYPPATVPAPGTDAHHRRFVTNVLIAAAALAFLSLILFGVSVAVRRRQIRRRRRQALLAPAPAATTNDPEGGGGGGGGGVVHHVWYIRTVGLEEAAIASIAATRYRAGAPGLVGAADCSVCLGEFGDGELLRLLPKCGHAFHVPCIDTWLRAHVNCPLCRSDVIDSAATAIQVDADPAADPDANANVAADQVPTASDPTLEHEEADEDDQEAPHVQDNQHEHQPSSPEPSPLPQPPCPLPRNMRRAASMDAALVSAAADVAALDRLPEAAPEGEQSDREKDLSTETPAPAAGPPRFFFSRHCRARSSVLPL
ncbi:RING-H2 finger protein ATL51-like [Lolium rigidum]|uniref:RING-H2 finger protein ATL51-like n=1 Tax=Lolium rigidum TaxID=89674 RepID=UPI001F5DCED6|nr:RING-H2 finger protein ATL51-like [Lolium rigidum]